MSAETRAVLEEQKKKLDADIAALTEPPEEGSAIGFGKRVGEGTNAAIERIVDVDRHGRLLEQLADVNRALEKLDEGTYGTCDECGDAIADARLEGRPWSTHCVTCAAAKG